MSLDADQERAILVPVTAPTVNPDGTDGGCVSPVGHAAVVAVTDACGDRFPAASKASTPRAYDVPHVSPENVALVDDVEPAPEPSRYKP